MRLKLTIGQNAAGPDRYAWVEVAHVVCLSSPVDETSSAWATCLDLTGGWQVMVVETPAEVLALLRAAKVAAMGAYDVALEYRDGKVRRIRTAIPTETL